MADLDGGMAEALAKEIGRAKGQAIVASNAQFAIVLNLLMDAGITTREEVVDQIDAQIAHLGDEDVTMGLTAMRELLIGKSGPILTVVDGGKED